MSMLGIFLGLILAYFGVFTLRDGAERNYLPAIVARSATFTFGLLSVVLLAWRMG